MKREKTMGMDNSNDGYGGFGADGSGNNNGGFSGASGGNASGLAGSGQGYLDDDYVDPSFLSEEAMAQIQASILAQIEENGYSFMSDSALAEIAANLGLTSNFEDTDYGALTSSLDSVESDTDTGGNDAGNSLGQVSSAVENSSISDTLKGKILGMLEKAVSKALDTGLGLVTGGVSVIASMLSKTFSGKTLGDWAVEGIESVISSLTGDETDAEIEAALTDAMSGMFSSAANTATDSELASITDAGSSGGNSGDAIEPTGTTGSTTDTTGATDTTSTGYTYSPEKRQAMEAFFNQVYDKIYAEYQEQEGTVNSAVDKANSSLEALSTNTQAGYDEFRNSMTAANDKQSALYDRLISDSQRTADELEAGNNLNPISFTVGGNRVSFIPNANRATAEQIQAARNDISGYGQSQFDNSSSTYQAILDGLSTTNLDQAKYTASQLANTLLSTEYNAETNWANILSNLANMENAAIANDAGLAIKADQMSQDDAGTLDWVQAIGSLLGNLSED